MKYVFITELELLVTHTLFLGSETSPKSHIEVLLKQFLLNNHLKMSQKYKNTIH